MSTRFTPEKVREELERCENYDPTKPLQATPDTEWERVHRVLAVMDERYGRDTLERTMKIDPKFRPIIAIIGIVLHVADELQAERSRETMAMGAAALEAAAKAMKDKAA